MEGPKGLVIAVMLGADGQINVQGPLDNPVLCYGMLEAGKDAVRRYAEARDKAAAEEPRIVTAPAGALRLLTPPGGES